MPVKFNVLCISTLCFLLSVFVVGQEATGPQPTFRHYTVNDGLPSSEVYRVEQDSLGYMWFATDKGVAKFDGYTFKTYTLSDGLTDNSVLYFHNDRQGRRWCITLNNRLCYFKGDSIYPFAYNDTIAKYLESTILIDFYVAKDGVIYIASKHNGLLQIRLDGSAHHTYDMSVPGLRVQPVDERFIVFGIRRQKNVLASSALLGYNLEWGNDETVLDLASLGDAKNIISPRFFASSDGYICSYGKWLVFADRQLRIAPIDLQFQLNYLDIDRDGTVWAGLHSGGALSVTIQKDDTLIQTFLGSTSVTSTTGDANGGRWFSTLDNGVYYTPNMNIVTFDERLGWNDQNVSCLTHDTQHVYAGTQTGGLVQISKHAAAEVARNRISAEVKGIGYNPVTGLVLADVYPIVAYDPRFEALETIGHRDYIQAINTFCVSYDSSVWFGNSRGVFQWKNDQFLASSISENGEVRVFALHELPSHKLLVGSINGLFLWDKKGKFQRPLGDERLRNRIDGIAEYRDMIALATHSEGLLLWKNETLLQLTVDDGLPSNTITSVRVSGGSLWLGTTNGVCRVKPHRATGWLMDLLQSAHGLPSADVQDIEMHDGKLWIATDKGISFVDTGYFRGTTNHTQLYLSGININDKDTTLAEYSLPYTYNRVSIAYVGINYGMDGEVLYRYRLNGLDTIWRTTTSTSVTFPSLPEGDYIFEVQGANANGEWSGSPVTYTFSIQPPFWRTWWFQLGLTLMIIATIYWFFRIRILTYNRDVVREILEAVAAWFRKRDERFILVKSVADGTLVKVRLRHLLWLEASRNYVELVLHDERIVARGNLKELQEQLAEFPQVIRIHKSYMVNLDLADAVTLKEIKLNGITLPVGRSFRDAVKTYKQKLEEQAG